MYPAQPSPAQSSPAHILLRGHSGFKGAWISQWFSTHLGLPRSALPPPPALRGRAGRGGDVNAHNSCSPQRAAAATPRGDPQPAANSAAPQPASANGGGHQVSRLRKTATNYNLLPLVCRGWPGWGPLHVESRSCAVYVTRTQCSTQTTQPALPCTAHYTPATRNIIK